MRVEKATEGSFCLCRKGSPPGQPVPETMFTFAPGCGLMRTALAQADVVERLTQKPKPRLELFVQKIAAGFKPGTVGLAKSVSPLAAAVPVPF